MSGVIQKNQLMQVLQQTPPAAIAELDFVKDKFVQNYNACHKDKLGELIYHRNVVYFKQAIAASDQLQKADPFSLYACFLTVGVKNYSLDPEDNEVYLYTMGGKAVLKRQAGAHVRSLMECGQIKYAEQAKLVYKGDVFEVESGRVTRHIEKFESEEIIAGYIRFMLPGNADRFFIYRKSDWTAWKSKSPQASGANWTGNGGQPLAAFLRTKIVLHACKEKSWATGNTNPNVETFSDIEVDDDEPTLPDPPPNSSYQPAMVVTPAGEVQQQDDDNFVQTQTAATGTVTYDDDSF